MTDKDVETCRAMTDTGRCDCEEHSPSSDNPSKCEECGHGRSKHPRPTVTSSSDTSVGDIFRKHAGNIKDSVKAQVAFDDARQEALKGLKQPSGNSASKSKKVHHPCSDYYSKC